MVRGSGIAWDIRKMFPYDGYDSYDFSIPVGRNGDSFDRYCVRIEEMRTSVSLILQALNKLEEGQYKLDLHKFTNPTRANLKYNMEALIHHFNTIQKAST